MKPTTSPTMSTTLIRSQPLPKLSMVACAQRRSLRGVVPLRRKKAHVRRIA